MISRLPVRLGTAAIFLIAAGCRRDAVTAPAIPVPVQGPPTFDISDSSAAPGATVTGALTGHFAAGEQALSFTARIRYDSTIVRFAGASSAVSGAQQAVNAADGLVRIAGIATGGFAPTAPLAALRFTVLKGGVRSAFSLTLDELHTNRGPAALLTARSRRGLQSSRSAGRGPAATNGAVWQSIGPAGSALATAGISGPNPPVYVGRVSSIALDAQGTDLYVGAATGGVWHASALGAPWTALTDTQCSLNIGAVAIDPVNPRIVYAGTGEYDTFLPGCGLLRSTDGGATWTALGADVMIPPSNVGLCFSSIYIDSASAGGASTTLLVGTTAGLYRSTNSGATWTHVLGGLVSAVVRRPDSSNVLFAGAAQPFSFTERAVYRSADGGLTWKALPPLPDPASPLRFALATTPAAPSNLFVAVPSPKNSVLGAYEWDDDAETWSRLTLTSANINLLGNQANYDLVIAVDPADAARIYVAGRSALRSVDGGASFSPIGGTVHLDWHTLAFDPHDSNVLYAGTDGGVYESADGGDTWTAYNAGLAITQFYPGIGVDSEATTIVGGTQDNGAQRYSGSPFWRILVTGDAGSAVLNPHDPFDAYAVTLDGTVWHFAGTATVNGGHPAGAGRGQLVMDPAAPKTLYYGWQNLYQSTDAGVTWRVVSPSLPRLATGFVSALAMAPTDPKTMYAGTNDGYVQVTRDGAATFSLSTEGLPSRTVTHIAVDPSDASHAVLAMSGTGAGHVFETHDYGARWTDISARLPNVAANTAIFLPGSPAIFVGTDHGAYQTGDDGATWQPIGAGLPNGMVEDLAYAPGAHTIVAATYGRGMFALTLGGGGGVLVGDVNEDGAVDGYDALLVAQNGSARGVPADANCDGRIDAQDVALILEAAVGLPTAGACVDTIR